MAKKKNPREDQAFRDEIEASLKVSSYADHILDKLLYNKEIPKGMVPDLSTPGVKNAYSNEGSMLGTADLFQTAAGALGADGLVTAMDSSPLLKTAAVNKPAQPVAPAKPKLHVSANQLNALKRYPALVEFLGGPDGEKLANQILLTVNLTLADKISVNTKAVNKYAQGCKAEKQNIKAYFVGEDDEWVCCVIASGPFRGDEAFYYKLAEDKSFVLRKIGNEYHDVSSEFNVIHELVRKDEQ